MLYKPEFCCQCGEQIERIRWKLWTSRRFCQLCETEFVLEDWMPRFILGINLIFGLFFISSLFLTPRYPENRALQAVSPGSQEISTMPAPPTVSDTNGAVNTAGPENQTGSGQSLHPEINRQREALKENQREKPAVAQTGIPAEKKTEPVYFCGAETKKGTPCSRRVKGGGRCWQHLGKESLLPADKLIVSQ